MDHETIKKEPENVDALIHDIHHLLDGEQPRPEPVQEPAEEPATAEVPAEEAPAEEPAEVPAEAPAGEAPQRWTDRQKVPKHVAKLQNHQQEAYALWLKEQEEKGEQPPPVFEEELPADSPGKEPAKKSRFALWFSLALVLCTLLFAAVTYLVLPQQPLAQSDHIHAAGASTVLLAGTDDAYGRTNMLMLLSVNTAKGKLSLVSLPKDIPVVTEDGTAALGTVYGLAGGGDAGIEALAQAVRQCVGFVPDGCLVLYPEALPAFVDALGGTRQGQQALTGEEALALVSDFGENEADEMTCLQTQRQLLWELIGQCRSAGAVLRAPKLLDAISLHAVTDMTTRNLLWLARAAVTAQTGTEDMTTLPGTELEGGSYLPDAELTVQTVNAYCNPYIRAIAAGDLSLVGSVE